MVLLKKIVALSAFAVLMAHQSVAFSQDSEAELGETLMQLDGTGLIENQVGTAAALGWLTCEVIRTGAGWGNHYVALTCPSGPFSNKWHIMKSNQKDSMLATALTAASTNKKVTVNIAPPASGSHYNVIRALYWHK